MLKFLGASAILDTILDFLGIAGIIFFGSFLIILVVDLILSAVDEREGIFFNKNKTPKQDTVVEAQQEKAQEEEPVAENGVIYYDRPNENQEEILGDEMISSVDFDKAVEEQQALQAQLDRENAVKDDYVDQDEVDEENIEQITQDVADEAIRQLNEEQAVKDEKVFKFAEETPVEESLEELATEDAVVEPVEETAEETVIDEPMIVEVQENEDVKRLEEERSLLEQRVAELQGQRDKDHEEVMKTLQELRDKEPVVVEVEKDDAEQRKLANIARMNSRLSRIKSSTKKIEEKSKEEKVAPKVEEVVETPVVEVVEEQKVETDSKPRFKKEYYENRLEVLEQNLADVQKEFKQNKKDYAPIAKVYKTFEKDTAKLSRQEAIVAKQQISVNGVNKKGKVSEAKKAKLEENMKQLKQLQESVYSCQQVIEKNKDRFPILEKNHKLLSNQIERLTADIASVKEALKWYEENEAE